VSPHLTERPSLAQRLSVLAADEKWAFRDWMPREQLHGLFQYPAMMVPQMQRELMLTLREESSGALVYDPFVGSGTTMAEAMLLGMDFVGTDVNPLAVLLCRAKMGPFQSASLDRASERVVTHARASRRTRIDLQMGNWEKWFRADVAVRLVRLQDAIRAEPRLSVRRFMWIVLAETVRLVSNSRTSTVKLHIRPLDEIRGRKIDVLAVFARTMSQNLERFEAQGQALRDEGLLTAQGFYTSSTEVHLHDASSEFCPGLEIDPAGLLLTSPPYGDNQTTVPYGQHAYLPLQWIDLEDIDANAGEHHLASTHAIDAMSIGSPTRGAMDAVLALRASAPSLDRTLSKLASAPPDRARRVAAFWRDLDSCLTHIIAGLSPGALMAWTVGNRRVGGFEIPMDDILVELLECRGAQMVVSLSREIPECRKRMASRNSIATTMLAEKVIVMRQSSLSA
jgi:hypothetical protein